MNYGYIRVSTNKQTVEIQRSEILDYCNRNGLIIDEWIEETISGCINPSARLLGSRVLNRINKGDLILVTEISRLSRNVFACFSIINHCMLVGAQILLVWRDQIIRNDSDSVYSIFFEILTAQKEREAISKRTRSALRIIKESGIKLGPPQGERRRKLDDHREEIIGMLNLGISKAEIARTFNVNNSTLFEWIRIRLQGGNDYKQKYK